MTMRRLYRGIVRGVMKKTVDYWIEAMARGRSSTSSEKATVRGYETHPRRNVVNTNLVEGTER